MQPVQPLPWKRDPKRGPGLYDAAGAPVSFTANADFIEFMAERWPLAAITLRAIEGATRGSTTPSTLATVHHSAAYAVSRIDGELP